MQGEGANTNGRTRASVSVVICTRDRPHYLHSALDRIAESTPPWVDVIVVDSASVDGRTRAEVERSSARYVRCETPGLSRARNAGIREALGDLVVFTDDDCLTTDGWIDAVTAPFEDQTVGCVTGLLLDHSLAESAGGELAEAPQARRLTQTVEGLDAGHGALMAFRRSLVLDEDGFDEQLGAGERLAGAEDLDMFIRLLHRGHVIVREPSAVVVHVNTREDADYGRLRYGYGLGLGALANKRLRLATGSGTRLSAKITARAVKRWVSGLSSARERRAGLAGLRGVASGFRVGMRLPLVHERFVGQGVPQHTPSGADAD